MRILTFGWFLLLASLSLAQSKDGAWDNVRVTNETIILEAGKRTYIKTADFPPGTTELVYRISLLDDNQKLSSSLVSILKAVPDPTGISQGTAGAVFLLSSISGDDKCKFAVFTNEADAIAYQKSGVAKNACFTQDEPVNKAARLLSENSKCVPQGVKNLYFGFQSENWVMKEKIILEVVPWVNFNLKNDWNTQSKNEVIEWGKGFEVTQKLAKKDLFLGYFVEAVTQKYTYAEYKKLLAPERTKLQEVLTDDCLRKSGQFSEYLESVREDARMLNFTGKPNEAIVKIQNEIIDRNRAKDADYGLLGNLYLATKQFVKAEEAYQKAIAMNQSELDYQLKLAHVYLFTDRINEAKSIHEKYKKNNLSNYKSWPEQTKFDFEAFEKNGFDTRNFKKILRIFK